MKFCANESQPQFRVSVNSRTIPSRTMKPPLPPPTRSPNRPSMPRIISRNASVGFSEATQPVAGRQRAFSSDRRRDGDSAQVRIQEQTDYQLLMASLERPNVEEAAEATLLDVLERRHVAYINPDTGSSFSGHRRHRTYTESLPTDRVLVSKSTDPPEGRPSSAPYPEVGIPRPGRIRRFASSTPVSNLDERDETYRERKHGQVASYLGPEGEHHRYPNFEFIDRFRRNPGVLSADKSPRLSEDHVSSETAAGDSSAIRDRAFHVAMAMKSYDGANSMDDPFSNNDRGLTELVNLVESKREHDDNSRGSSGWSKGSRDHSMEVNCNEESSNLSSERWRRQRLQKIFMGISSPFGSDHRVQSNVETLFQAADHIQELCKIPEEDECDEVSPTSKVVGSLRSYPGSIRSQALASENANFLQEISNSHPDVPELPSDDIQDVENKLAGEVDEHTPILEKARIRRTQAFGDHRAVRRTRFRAIHQRITSIRKQLKMLWAAFDFAFVKDKIWDFVQFQLSCIILPSLAVATFYFYRLGNPSLPFLSTDTSVSWWILFAIRSYLTLQLAFITEYLLVDVLAMRSPMCVKMMGPLVTLYTINAKGWPFLLTFWGVWSFALVHGHGFFHEHWLWFTEIEMLRPDNKADGIVDSETYTSILISIIFAGIATSIKRTILALYLGKRIYINYKPKLEKLMIDMLLLTEVADLAMALDEYDLEKVRSPFVTATHASLSRFSSDRQCFKANTMVEFVRSNPAQISTSDDDEGGGDRDSQEPISWNRLRSNSESSADEFETDNANASHNGALTTNEFQKTPLSTKSSGSEFSGISIQQSIGGSQTELDGIKPPEVNSDKAYLVEPPSIARPGTASCGAVSREIEPPIDTVEEPVRDILHGESSTTHIKSLLDRWEEPVNKLDQGSKPTIHEILQFRKALSFLDDTHPFGLSFGTAFSRDTCIKSSSALYKRLLGFDVDSPVLHFDVIGVLAYDADGNFDEKKAKGLVRLFRPDRFDEVTLLAFVQSCDGVYKRLRYLRASVGNSTSIDIVLENIFSGIFNFFLFLTVLSIMKLNPWALLVSLSTVLVSFAFALGPSAAKMIEGMMMIAIRRPFDLGDRISISGPNDRSGDDDPGFNDAWLVEDCGLFRTTLRLCRTNEISYINNGTLSNCKIINHGRSQNALLNLLIPMKLEATHEQVQIVRSALDQYIQNNPRVWACLVFWRVAQVDPNLNLLTYSVRVQHVKTWQDHTSIMQARGDLQKFCFEILMKLGIDYRIPAKISDVFVKQLPPFDAITSSGYDNIIMK